MEHFVIFKALPGLGLSFLSALLPQGWYYYTIILSSEVGETLSYLVNDFNPTPFYIFALCKELLHPFRRELCPQPCKSELNFVTCFNEQNAVHRMLC